MIVNFQEHGSNERTFLAWVRTVVAIVGFGIGAGRIGTRGPEWTEAAVLITGGIVILVAWVRMLILRRRINSDAPADDEAPILDGILLVVVIGLFTLLAVFALNVLA